MDGLTSSAFFYTTISSSLVYGQGVPGVLDNRARMSVGPTTALGGLQSSDTSSYEGSGHITHHDYEAFSRTPS